MSALALYHKDAVVRVKGFMADFPESPLALQAHWELANYHYKRKNYSRASEEFMGIRIRDLAKPKRDELRFKLGHCFFEREAFEKARVYLYDVLDVEGEFQAPAQYYFSHIAYLNGQPQVALDGFERIADHPAFAELVPLYIAQLCTPQDNSTVSRNTPHRCSTSRVGWMKRAWRKWPTCWATRGTEMAPSTPPRRTWNWHGKARTALAEP